MTIFFTSDTHFGHANIIRYCDRPFQSKLEHDEKLIENWNSVVKPKDLVYHLGDFGFGSAEWLASKIASKLHGHIYLIKGNHDKSLKSPLLERFSFVKDVHFLCAQCRGKKVELFLSHYGHRSWPKHNYGVIHLYGHSHGKLPPYYHSMDVGVDCWNFMPISLEFVVDHMSKISLDKIPEDVILPVKDEV